MKKSRFSETQIVNALKEYEAGKSVADLCRELGVNMQTLLQLEEQVQRNGFSRSKAP